MLSTVCYLQAQKASGSYLPVKAKVTATRSQCNVGKKKSRTGNPMENLVSETPQEDHLSAAALQAG